ncbi:MAG: acyl-CoA dehydrogenase family protein [Rhodococcus sp. (in: high G+C Gram-positive bacteria)]
MDFTFDEAQTDIAALTRDVVARSMDAAHQNTLDDLPHRIDKPLMEALVAADVWAASVPTEHGGSGLSILHDCSIAIELGRALAAVPFTTSASTCAGLLVSYAADQRIRTLGTDAALGRCILAPATAEDLMEGNDRPTVTATATDDGWTVTGTKVTVPFGEVADAFLVTVRCDDSDRVLVIARTEPGVRVTPVIATGSDCAAQLDLDNVVVPTDAALSAPGMVDLVGLLRERSTVLACAVQLGVLERSLELVSEYAAERRQFGRPIGSFQAVAQRLADAYIDVAAARSTLWRAAWTLGDTGDHATNRHELSMAISTAKFWAAEAGHRTAHTHVHVHGGVGIDTSHIAHRYFLAAKHGEFVLGHATASLIELGRELVSGGSTG